MSSRSLRGSPDELVFVTFPLASDPTAAVIWTTTSQRRRLDLDRTTKVRVHATATFAAAS